MKKIISILASGPWFVGLRPELLPLDAISPETFFNTENDLLLYTNSFYNALPSAEDVYNEDADNVVKNSLRDEIRERAWYPPRGRLELVGSCGTSTISWPIRENVPIKKPSKNTTVWPVFFAPIFTLKR